MANFKNLFALTDKLGMVGCLGMWLSFFTTSFVVLLVDDAQGPARDFCAASQLLCCTNMASIGWALVNKKSWSEAGFYTMNFDTFATWLAFAYFGGGDVVDSTTLGVWNGVQVAGTALNTAFGVASMYAVARDYEGFSAYLGDSESVVAADV